MRYFLICLLIICLTGCTSARAVVKQPTTAYTKDTKNIKPPAPKSLSLAEIRLRFPVPGGEISSPFGVRKGDYHRGVDIASEEGTAVLACLDGEVIRVGTYKFASGYGKSIMLKHGSDLYTYYAHMSQVEVKRNQKVTSGQRIGKVGNTGKSRGPHLHLELIKGKKQYDPVLYFEARYISKVKDILQNFKQGLIIPPVIRKLIGE